MYGGVEIVKDSAREIRLQPAAETIVEQRHMFNF